MSSRQEQKAQARAAREQAQQQSTDAQRRRRLLQLGGALLVAAIVAVVVVVVASGGSDSKSGSTATTTTAPKASLFAGIPQRRLTVGKATAPVTIVEYNDMQCPFCGEYTRNVLPTLVRDYVRTGKVRMEMRLQSFIGPDSVKAGKAVAAAGNQNLAWSYADAFYNNQGEENTGYVTDEFLRSMAKATPGLDANKLLTDIDSPAAAATLKAGQADFDRHGLDSTPSFLIGKTGGPMSVLHYNELTVPEFTGPIDSLLGT